MKKTFLIAIFLVLISSQAFARVVKIDLASITTLTKLHEVLERDLSFPGYYGKNWDAFNDCMRDILVEGEIALVFEGRATFKRYFPRDARILFSVLRDLQKEYPGKLRVVAFD